MGVPYYMVASHDPPKDKIPDNDPCLQVTADQFPCTANLPACSVCMQRERERETYKPLASPVVFADDGCTHKVKYEPFDIPVAQFEATLINALQQIGVNAVPKRRN